VLQVVFIATPCGMAGDAGTIRWLALAPSSHARLTSQDLTHGVSIEHLVHVNAIPAVY